MNRTTSVQRVGTNAASPGYAQSGVGIMPVFVSAAPTSSIPVTPTSPSTVAKSHKHSTLHLSKPIFAIAAGIILTRIFQKVL